MPSSRQFKVIGLCTVLALLIIYYVSNGAQSTYESDFYKNTKAAIDRKRETAERDQILHEERDRLNRVERLKKEHEQAVEDLETTTSESRASGDGEEEGLAHGSKPQKQEPIAVDDAAEKSVAGRKKVPQKTDPGSKVVQSKPDRDTDDGVAKVGNIAKQTNRAAAAASLDDDDSEDEAKIDMELDSILKKGPIIIFSKSYCPYSKKAKHILLELYGISPPPYVVELDQHPLGAGLQQHLHKSTGRRTVPNVLINGRSIGGGDDIQALHDSGKLIDTVTSMGGKRIVSAVVRKQPLKARSEAKEMEFKA